MARDKSFYLPELTGLRFFAFLGVFACHSYPLTIAKAGGCGVDLFFTLSAYLITTLLLREVEKTGTIDVSAFYVRRLMRIWPLYFGFLGLVLIGNHRLPWEFFTTASAFIGNFYVLQFRATTAAVVLWSVCASRNSFIWCGRGSSVHSASAD
jgi:peptidoglycan/LPS O-acetylase OafA/YrhL